MHQGLDNFSKSESARRVCSPRGICRIRQGGRRHRSACRSPILVSGNPTVGLLPVTNPGNETSGIWHSGISKDVTWFTGTTRSTGLFDQTNKISGNTDVSRRRILPGRRPGAIEPVGQGADAPQQGHHRQGRRLRTIRYENPRRLRRIGLSRQRPRKLPGERRVASHWCGGFLARARLA